MRAPSLAVLLVLLCAGPGGCGSHKAGDAVVTPADGAATGPAPEAMGCGAPGQRCCPGNMCQAGGCCTGCACVASGQECSGRAGICSGGSCGACGGLGQPCCGGSLCTAPNTLCGKDGRCAPCGGLGQPCCEGACTAPGTLCDSGPLTCRSCGQPGQPCCAGFACYGGGCCVGEACVGPGSSCSAPDGGVPGSLCTAGRCSGCGQPGGPCCAHPPGCPGHELTCVSDNNFEHRTCQHCGAEGELCCDSPPLCAGGLACVMRDTRCRRCGGPGQPCCPGDRCDGAGCCVRDTCVAEGAGCPSYASPAAVTCQAGKCVGCGGPGQPCCPDRPRGENRCNDPNLLCDQGTSVCRGCGGADQPCCPFNVCRDGGCCVQESTYAPARCVAPGKPCRSSGGYVCGEGSCAGCGGLGQPCCTTTENLHVFCSGPSTDCSETPNGLTCVYWPERCASRP